MIRRLKKEVRMCCSFNEKDCVTPEMATAEAVL